MSSSILACLLCEQAKLLTTCQIPLTIVFLLLLRRFALFYAQVSFRGGTSREKLRRICGPACIRSCVFRVIDQSSLILEIIPLLAWVFSRNSDISVRYLGFYHIIFNQIERLLINSGLVSILIILLTVNIRPQSVLIVLVSYSN